MKLASMSKVKSAPEKSFVPGTKIPISFLLDYFKEGLTINDFISAYPWVKKDKVKKALDEVKSRDFAARNVL